MGIRTYLRHEKGVALDQEYCQLLLVKPRKFMVLQDLEVLFRENFVRVFAKVPGRKGDNCQRLHFTEEMEEKAATDTCDEWRRNEQERATDTGDGWRAGSLSSKVPKGEKKG